MPFRLLLPLAFFSIVAACSGGSGGGSADGFQLTGISLQEGQVIKVNQEIVFTFNQDVDFSSVSLNTISIQSMANVPATGTFFRRSSNQIVFQPNCPSTDGLTDTGLMPGAVEYEIRVLGRSSGAGNTVRSSTGAFMAVTQVVNFVTASSGTAAFLDTAAGPPVPVLQAAGTSTPTDATYLEVGGRSGTRFYFKRGIVPATFDCPLNLYSNPATRIAIVIAFNQAIVPSSDNLQFLQLEFQEGLDWIPLETRVSLEANCTETGARVRLEPVGVLPRGSLLRAVVRTGLLDLVGDPTLAPEETFAVVPTAVGEVASLTPPDLQSDEFHESFDFGGSSPLSFQDTNTLSELPTAAWAGGRLTAAFDFGGSGGPGGAFDWLVRDGDRLILDTDGGAILAADGVTAQVINGGIVDVRNLTIEANGTVRVQGTKPLQINASGTVIIRGTLDLSGFAARDVDRINSGDEPEFGGKGGPGGGDGGNANEVVTNSTARGSFGQGPAGTVNAGGQGGETGWAPASASKDARRPGGGGGGRFALDQGTGLSAENGLAGSLDATGAVSNLKPPAGGLADQGPFVDGNLENDFFGTRAVGMPGNVTLSIRGELARLWGGHGGGGGGNADPASMFPTPSWTRSSDEKGGAGGGGGGVLLIRSLGPIRFGAVGRILANGGKGALGENVQQQDHVGGNGGSGSGGHIVLETASFIDFTDGGVAVGVAARDWISALGGPRVTGTATPAGAVSHGGAGGPGVIQLHVPNSLTQPANMSDSSNIVVPTAALGASPIDAVTSPAAKVLIPRFGAQSRARSRWISIGGADRKPNGLISPPQFLFRGLDTSGGSDGGKILVSGSSVPELPPILDEALEANPNISLSGRLTLRIRGGSLDAFDSIAVGSISNDLYLRTPALMEDFILRLSAAMNALDFRVSAATYLEGSAAPGDEELRLTVVDEGIDLQDFLDANDGVRYQLIPRFFRVTTAGMPDTVSSNSFVRVLFQAAKDDGNGLPDEISPLVDWTGDISAFNSVNELQFFRFEVEFELNQAGGAVPSDTQPISLDFLRIPFVF